MSTVTVITYADTHNGWKNVPIWLCGVDASMLKNGLRPRWIYGGLLSSGSKSLSDLAVQLNHASKLYNLPVLAPVADKSIVTVAQLKLLPQTEEVQLLAVRLTLMESKLQENKWNKEQAFNEAAARILRGGPRRSAVVDWKKRK